MVAYDYSSEIDNPWDAATWSPRAQIDFMRRMRYKFGGTTGHAEARITQRIAQSDTKGMPPRKVAVVNKIFLIQGKPGRPGAPGAPGQDVHTSAEIMSCPASAIVAAFRVVAQDADGRVRHADPTDSADAYRIIGVSLNAAVVDAQVQIQQLGLISYAGWAFISGNPVFVDLDGVLTQLPTEAPMYAFALQIGGATGTNRMFINMGPPIFLTA